MGHILIIGIPSRNLKQLELSGNIYLSPHPSAQPLSLSQDAAQVLSHKKARSLRSPIAPSKSCGTLNSTSHNAPHTPAQPLNKLGVDHLSTTSHSHSQAIYNSRKQSVAGVNSNTMNPFSPFTSKIFALPTWAKLIIGTGINRPPRGLKLPASDSQPEQSQSLEVIA